MARLWSSGFELNSATTGMEWETSGPPTISSATKRTGGYAGRITSLSSGTPMYFNRKFAAANGNGPFWFRTYFYLHTAPNVNNTILHLVADSDPFALQCLLSLQTDKKIRCANGGVTTVGTSSALTLDQWYRLEVKFDNTGGAGAGVIEFYIDGSLIGSVTTLTPDKGIMHFRIGGNLGSQTCTAGDWFFDDVAVNDSSGSAQTAYPGAGSIVHLHPNGDGDNHGWKHDDGSAGDANNYLEVNETPTPDDATSYVKRVDTGTNIIDDYAVESYTVPGIGALDSISLVAVGVRFGALSATSTGRAGITRVKSQASGSVLESASFGWNVNGWRTNTLADPINYQLYSYTDPQAGGSWTPALLDSMQIGIRNNSSSANEIRCSNLWALVEYVPAVVGSKYIVGQAVKRSNLY